jgi:tetratricopeptide (TPR) repeat protein
MVRRISCFCLGLAAVMSVTVTGCNIGNKVAMNKSKGPAKPARQLNSSMVGSPDLESTRSANPVKVHLAYAAWHEQAGNFTEARNSYLKVLEKSPKDTDAMLGLARVDQAFGRNEEADLQLKKAWKAHPKDAKVLVAIGQVHAARNEWDEALEKMQAAHKLEPYETIYEYHLAVVETHMGDIPQALEHFGRSVGQAEGHYNIGFILKEQGKPVEAEAHLVKALKLKPDLKQAEAVLTAIRSGSSDEIQTASFKKTARP